MFVNHSPVSWVNDPRIPFVSYCMPPAALPVNTSPAELQTQLPVQAFISPAHPKGDDEDGDDGRGRRNADHGGKC